ncbi:hypothetical protein Psch_01577 [Pelotomaculum schinkii]|uniref:Uncharacterized protein n=1 Tax=Pelotomaculum schinkii TaxID=78350 RepID=A0A4Y7RH54_9FIRM|nr:hypothetical protein Psch_01577 [Pelotomaculum schinkii]
MHSVKNAKKMSPILSKMFYDRHIERGSTKVQHWKTYDIENYARVMFSRSIRS